MRRSVTELEAAGEESRDRQQFKRPYHVLFCVFDWPGRFRSHPAVPRPNDLQPIAPVRRQCTALATFARLENNSA
jgi:hypothetical protein